MPGGGAGTRRQARLRAGRQRPAAAVAAEPLQALVGLAPWHCGEGRVRLAAGRLLERAGKGWASRGWGPTQTAQGRPRSFCGVKQVQADV